MLRRALLVAVAFTTVALTSACDPIPWNVDDAQCYIGTWTVTGEQIATAVSSLGIPITLTPTGAGSGVTASITDDGHWSVTADQSFAVAGLHDTIDGSAAVSAAANGTYSATDTTIAFTLDNVTGSVSFSGTFLGARIDGLSLSLDQLGAQQLYGWSETAQYTCGTDGLTLTFPQFSLVL